MDVATMQRADGQEFLHNTNNNNNNNNSNNGSMACGLEGKGKLAAEVVSNEMARDFVTPKMSSSVASILDDTTPSDSGVQLLDSESSGLNESMISSAGGFEFDGGPTPPPPLPPTAESVYGEEGKNNNNNCSYHERPVAEMEIEAAEEEE
uniref:Uncharacterized protein n=1 Tax=Anopheles maculatus TaxID=74869 RepID=A0A182T9E8_9DIPT